MGRRADASALRRYRSLPLVAGELAADRRGDERRSIPRQTDPSCSRSTAEPDPRRLHRSPRESRPARSGRTSSRSSWARPGLSARRNKPSSTISDPLHQPSNPTWSCGCRPRGFRAEVLAAAFPRNAAPRRDGSAVLRDAPLARTRARLVANDLPRLIDDILRCFPETGVRYRIRPTSRSASRARPGQRFHDRELHLVRPVVASGNLQRVASLPPPAIVYETFARTAGRSYTTMKDRWLRT